VATSLEAEKIPLLSPGRGTLKIIEYLL